MPDNFFDQLDEDENFFDRLDREKKPVEKSYTWGETAKGFIKNFGPNSREFYTNLVKAAQAAGGAIASAPPDVLARIVSDPETPNKVIRAAQAVGGYVGERYGTVDAIKRTLAEKPVEALADISTLLTGGAGLVRGAATGVAKGAAKTAAAANAVSKAPAINMLNPGAVVNKKAAGANALASGANAVASSPVVKGADRVGRVINPMNAVTVPVSVAGRAAGAGVNMLTLGPKKMTYLAAAGNAAPEILKRLENPTEIVPGSKPTAHQAASDVGATRFSKLGEDASNVLPDEYFARQQAQANARVEQVRRVGGTEPDLQNAENIRNTASGLNYGQAGVSAKPGASVNNVIIPLDAAFQTLLPRLDEAGAMSRAQKIATVRGVPLFDANGNLTSQGAHYIKTALDDARTPNATTANERNLNAAVESVRQDYISWLEGKNPAYGVARSAHAKMSEPINRMEVGQYLEKKLLKPLEGDETVSQRAGVYAQALEDAPGTIKKASGESMGFQRLRDVPGITADDVAKLESVKDDLARAALTKEQARFARGGNPNVEKVGTETMGGARMPAFLNVVTTVANDVLRRLEWKINKQLAIDIATEMLDPHLAAGSLKSAMKIDARNKAAATAINGALAPVNALAKTPTVFNILADEREKRRNALTP